jgi:hypothetical protein
MVSLAAAGPAWQATNSSGCSSSSNLADSFTTHELRALLLWWLLGMLVLLSIVVSVVNTQWQVHIP